jgi:hypothetical protein
VSPHHRSIKIQIGNSCIVIRSIPRSSFTPRKNDFEIKFYPVETEATYSQSSSTYAIHDTVRVKQKLLDDF